VNQITGVAKKANPAGMIVATAWSWKILRDADQPVVAVPAAL
jgi:hypothetical protein